jgi:hypothetical protein
VTYFGLYPSTNSQENSRSPSPSPSPSPSRCSHFSHPLGTMSRYFYSLCDALLKDPDHHLILTSIFTLSTTPRNLEHLPASILFHQPLSFHPACHPALRRLHPAPSSPLYLSTYLQSRVPLRAQYNPTATPPIAKQIRWNNSTATAASFVGGASES